MQSRNTLKYPSITRRDLLKLGAAAVSAAAASNADAAAKAKLLPVGLELYSVRDELARDLMGAVRSVAMLGYEVVEFYSPYQAWTPEYAKEVRKLLDDLNIRCLSTHNSAAGLEGDGLKKAIELNQILGSRTIVMSSAGRTETRQDWRHVAEILSAASEVLRPLKMRAGYHNHQLEFTEKDAAESKYRPIQEIAANTPKDVTLQFDVGTCVEVGFDPVAWIKANPGRIRSLHLKDWGKGAERGYSVLFGEGDTPWSRLLDAAEKQGGA